MSTERRYRKPRYNYPLRYAHSVQKTLLGNKIATHITSMLFGVPQGLYPPRRARGARPRNMYNVRCAVDGYWVARTIQSDSKALSLQLNIFILVLEHLGPKGSMQWYHSIV